MRAETLRPALPEIEEAVGQFPGLQAAQAQPGDLRVAQNDVRQIFEVVAPLARQITAIAAQVDAG